jgi:outer membrane protein OmpA-like peptidoglycan-associated protein
MQIREITLMIGAVVAGCTVAPTRPVQEAPPVAASSSEEAVQVEAPAVSVYALLTPQQTHLVQVFDDTQRTYLSFASQVPASLLIFDDQGRAVPFVLGEHSVIVNAVRLGLLLRTPTQRSYAEAPRHGAAARVTGTGADGTPWLPADLAAARADILAAQQHLTGVSRQLDGISRGAPAVSLGALESEIEEIRTVVDGVTELLVRAHFASGRSLLALSATAQQALVAAAKQAAAIRIRGGADNSGSVAGNERLARARALSMRQLLLDRGIAGDKVHLGASLPGYIASNATPEGRAENRRVEVLFEPHLERPEPTMQPELSLGSMAESPVVNR